MFKLLLRLCIVIIAVVLGFFSFSATAQDLKDNPGYLHAKEVKEAHKSNLMSKKGVVGAGVSLDEQNHFSILIFTEDKKVVDIPKSIDGIPIKVVVTGKVQLLNVVDPVVDSITPLAKPMPPPPSPPPLETRFDRPVPIGASIGSERPTMGQFGSGTFGVRVKDSSGNVYALSNNHVIAAENEGVVGDRIYQPLTLPLVAGDEIGTLYDYQPFLVSPAINTMDAAIALSNTTLIGNATAEGGYGKPLSAIVPYPPPLKTPVMKYGRTTGLTTGTITAVDVTVTAAFSPGDLIFENQIIVSSNSNFVSPGDSGSLVVASNKKNLRKFPPDRSPVGLLWAELGSTMTLVSPIEFILNRFNVTIDGE